MLWNKKTPDSGNKVEVDESPSTIKIVRAYAECIFPIFYKGSIINIDDSHPVEIDVALLGYEPKIQFEQALADKHLIEESK